MTKIIVKPLITGLLLLLTMASGCQGTIQTPTTASFKKDEITLKTLTDEILTTAEDKISIEKYVLLLSKSVVPSTDIELQSMRLSNMADILRKRIGDETDPNKIIETINKYLFEETKFDTPNVTKEEGTTFKHALLPYVLDGREGNCVGLGMIYLCLAERLKLPVFGVSIPRHFFLRYDNGKNRINIDPTEKGKNISDNDYLKKFAPLVKDIDTAVKDEMLKNLSRKEVLGGYIGNGIVHKFIDEPYDFKSAVEYNGYALQLFPNSELLHSKQGEYLMQLADDTDNPEYEKQATKELIIAHQLYPYSVGTMGFLALSYYFAKDYKNSTKMFDELFQKFTWDDVLERFESEMTHYIELIHKDALIKTNK